MITQNDLEQVNKRIADLEGRRKKLLATLDGSKKDIRSSKSKLVSELLEGRSVENKLGSVATESVRVEGLEGAIEQAGVALQSLYAERAQIEQGIAIATYDGQVEEAKQKLFACIRSLYQFNETLGTVRLVRPREYTSNADELVRNMWEHLKGFDVYRHLIEFERIAPEFMTQARQAKGVK
jgi:hypothetical protein